VALADDGLDIVYLNQMCYIDANIKTLLGQDHVAFRQIVNLIYATSVNLIY